jgi:hypothetical protein
MAIWAQLPDRHGLGSFTWRCWRRVAPAPARFRGPYAAGQPITTSRRIAAHAAGVLDRPRKRPAQLPQVQMAGPHDAVPHPARQLQALGPADAAERVRLPAQGPWAAAVARKCIAKRCGGKLLLHHGAPPCLCAREGRATRRLACCRYEPFAVSPPEYCGVGNFSQTYQAASGWADTNCDQIFVSICQIRRERPWAARWPSGAQAPLPAAEAGRDAWSGCRRRPPRQCVQDLVVKTTRSLGTV